MGSKLTVSACTLRVNMWIPAPDTLRVRAIIEWLIPVEIGAPPGSASSVWMVLRGGDDSPALFGSAAGGDCREFR